MEVTAGSQREGTAMRRAGRQFFRCCLPGLFIGLALICATPASARAEVSIHNSRLTVTVNARDGSYEIRTNSLQAPVLEAAVGAEVNHRSLRSSDYPHHNTAQSTF